MGSLKIFGGVSGYNRKLHCDVIIGTLRVQITQKDQKSLFRDLLLVTT